MEKNNLLGAIVTLCGSAENELNISNYMNSAYNLTDAISRSFCAQSLTNVQSATAENTKKQRVIIGGEALAAGKEAIVSKVVHPKKVMIKLKPEVIMVISPNNEEVKKEMTSLQDVSDLINGLVELMKGEHMRPLNLGDPRALVILELAQVVKGKFKLKIENLIPGYCWPGLIISCDNNGVYAAFAADKLPTYVEEHDNAINFNSLVSLSYTRDISLLVVSNSIGINLVEVTWKSKLKAQLPNPSECLSGDFSTTLGIITFTDFSLYVYTSSFETSWDMIIVYKIVFHLEDKVNFEGRSIVTDQDASLVKNGY